MKWEWVVSIRRRQFLCIFNAMDTDANISFDCRLLISVETIQTITTILDNRPKLQHSKPGVKHPPSSPDLDERIREEALWKESLEQWHHEMEMANVPKSLLPKATKTRVGAGARAGTLVVCPVIALNQWKEEIEKFTENDALTICTYHGPNRASEFPPELLSKYDIVLTTYQVLEQDFRRMVSPNKVKCPNCGGAFKVRVLEIIPRLALFTMSHVQYCQWSIIRLTNSVFT